MNTTNQVEIVEEQFTETVRQDIELSLSDLDSGGGWQRHPDFFLADRPV